MGDVQITSVSGLSGVGSSIEGKAPSVGSHGNGIIQGLESVAGGVGHYVVAAATRTFNQDHIIDNAHKATNNTEAAGVYTKNVASTGRAADEDAASNMQGPVTAGTSLARDVNSRK